MNAIIRNLTLLAGLTLAAAAGAAERDTTLYWDCADQFPPSFGQTAEFYDLANPDQVYDARVRLHLTLQRACKGGAAAVQIVRKNSPAEETVRIVAR